MMANLIITPRVAEHLRKRAAVKPEYRKLLAGEPSVVEPTRRVPLHCLHLGEPTGNMVDATGEG
jgi:hypothetical protein